MNETFLEGEVIGFRQWRVSPELILRGAHKRKQFWSPGDNKAVCDIDQAYYEMIGKPVVAKHVAPHQHCECGFYALHRPNDFWYGKPGSAFWASASAMIGEEDPLVSGVIVAWGRLEVHHTGFRTQYARVVALGLSPTDGDHSKRNQAIARAAAAEYGVPSVPLDELPKIASEFGQVVPEDLRPDKPPANTTSVFGNALKQAWLQTPATYTSSWQITSGGNVVPITTTTGSGYAAGGPPKAVPLPAEPKHVKKSGYKTKFHYFKIGLGKSLLDEASQYEEKQRINKEMRKQK